MNTLSRSDTQLFYVTFRVLLDYSNRRFHLDDNVDLLHDEELDPNLCKQAADKIWENPSLIDDILRETDLADEQKDLMASWKNCVHDMFIVERHLKSGSIFIGSNKVYQVLGLNDALGDLFAPFPKPTIVRATLLPFRDVIITDGLYDILPVFVGPGMRYDVKNTYMQAKYGERIICQLPANIHKKKLESIDPSVKQKDVSTKKHKKPVCLYNLKVYPKGKGRNVYRLIEICGNATLAKLCTTILDAFDFDADHLYEFCMDNKMYGHDAYKSNPDYGERSVRIRLDQLDLIPGQKFSLHYDFGDDWMFVIRVNNITECAQQTKPRITRSVGEIVQY